MSGGGGSQVRTKALGLVNQFKQSGEDEEKKTNLIKDLIALDIPRVPYSAEDILREVVALKFDPESPAVKTELLNFLEQVLTVALGWEVVCPTVECLCGLLACKDQLVGTRVIQTCPKIAKNVLQQAIDKGNDPILTDGWKQAWEAVVHLTQLSIRTAFEMEDGPVFIYAAKLTEQTVLMHTEPSSDASVSGFEHHQPIPSNNPVFDTSALYASSQELVMKLIQLIKPASITHLQGASKVACIRSLGTIARLRPAMVGRIAPAFLQLCVLENFKVAGAAGGASKANGVDVSVSFALKEALLGALKNKDPLATVWRNKLVEGLKKIGAGGAAEQAVRSLDRQTDKEKRARKADRPIKEESWHVKRLKRDTTNSAFDQNAAPNPTVHHQPLTEEIVIDDADQIDQMHQPDNGPQTGPGPAPGLELGSGSGVEAGEKLVMEQDPRPSSVHENVGPSSCPAGSGSMLQGGRLDVNQVRAILGLLAATGQKALLNGFVKNLDVRILADVVIANLKDLPAREGTPRLSDVEPTHLPMHKPHSEEPQAPLNPTENREPPPPSPPSPPIDPIDNGPEENVPGTQAPDMREATENGIKTEQEATGTSAMEVDGENVDQDSRKVDDNRNEDVDGGAVGGVDVKMEEIVDDAGVAGQVNDRTQESGPVVVEQVDMAVEDQSRAEHGMQGGAAVAEPDGLPLRPKSLTPEACKFLVEQGVAPLIRANTGTNRHAAFCQTVLAKLAARGSVNESPAEDVLTHIADTFPERTAHELAIKWLYAVFLEHGAPDPPPQDFQLPAFEEVATESGDGSRDEVDCVDDQLNVMEWGDHDPGVYEDALSALLLRLSTKIADPKDRSIPSLLLEAPALPPIPLCRFLIQLCSRGSHYATLALTTAHGVMEERPPLKQAMLDLILHVAISKSTDTREKAIRLVKNKLHGDKKYAGKTEQFAVESLNRLTSAQEEESADEAGGGGEDWGRFCGLYMALCTSKRSLLRGLMEVYGTTIKAGQEAIYSHAPKLADAIGYNSPELLELIRDTPPGAEKLLLLMLTVMPKRIPSQVVVSACIERYNAKNDVRFIVPALPGLPKRDALNMVRRLVSLPLPEFSAAILSLIARPRIDEPVEPSEVLVALNRENVHEETVNIAQLRPALNHCLKELTDIFDQKSLAGALNKMVQMPSLPVLFMRMVLMSVSREKSLIKFVLETLLLSSVVTDKIRPEERQWKGYLMLMRQTAPWSFKHLVELPTGVMKAALQDLPPEFSQRLYSYANGKDCDVRVAVDSMNVIKTIVEAAAEASSQAGGSQSAGGSVQTGKGSAVTKEGQDEMAAARSGSSKGVNGSMHDVEGDDKKENVSEMSTDKNAGLEEPAT